MVLFLILFYFAKTETVGKFCSIFVSEHISLFSNECSVVKKSLSLLLLGIKTLQTIQIVTEDILH